MTSAYQCDRCGEYKEREMAYLRMKTFGRPMYRDYPAEPDLCNECEGAFAKFMEGENDD